MHACEHRVGAETRGQPVGVGSVPPPCKSNRLDTDHQLGGNTFIH